MSLMLDYCLENRMSCEALKKMMPEGYNSQLWELAVGDIDLIAEGELEQAKEQKRDPDIGMLLAEMHYVGFLTGIGAVMRYLHGIPGSEGMMLVKLIHSSEELEHPF